MNKYILFTALTVVLASFTYAAYADMKTSSDYMQQKQRMMKTEDHMRMQGQMMQNCEPAAGGYKEMQRQGDEDRFAPSKPGYPRQDEFRRLHR